MPEFMQFIAKHGKSYTSMDELQMRMDRYNKVDAYIKEHYAENATPNYHVGHNEFSDWTEQEYKGMLGYKKMSPKAPASKKTVSTGAIPTEIDWRNKNAVNPIKNQGACGSCWTFATTAILAGAHSVQTNGAELLSFSEQSFVDCVHGQYNYGYISEPEPCCAGCNGGDYDASFSWAGNNTKSLILESEYAYKAVDGICNWDHTPQTGVTVVSYTDVPSNDPAALKIAVAQQPVGIGVDAGQLPFQTYQSGILDSPNCYKAPNHAITIVGYGVDPVSSMEFWIVRNSWGAAWGEGGYIKIANTQKNDVGICGINESPAWATTAGSK